MNAINLVEDLRAQGLSAELAFEVACLPSPDELVVVWVDRNTRTLGAHAQMDLPATHEGPWDDFVPRYCGPIDTASSVSVGDLVTPRKGA